MRKRIYIVGSLVDQLDYNEALKKIENFIKDGKPRHIITANAEIIYMGLKDKRLSRTLNKADLVTADGAGVVWASHYLGFPEQKKVSGIDLLHKICAEAQKKGWTLYFLGGAPKVAERAVLKVLELYPSSQIAGYENGYFSQEEEPEIIENIKKANPDILFVALGAPKQEFWIREHLQELNVPICMGVGGSFDVLAGEVRRAPKWMQKYSIEWLYRLLQDPSRWRRMLALPKFALKVVGQKTKKDNEEV